MHFADRGTVQFTSILGEVHCSKAIVAALALLIFSAGNSLADGNKSAQSSCEGPTNQSHPYGTFTFYTNSRVETINLGRYKYQVISCVADDDPVNPMRVKWLTPGPDGFIPPHEKLESVPRMSEVGLDPVVGTKSDALIKQLDGCILYGDRGDTTSATFFGISGDTSRVAKEAQVGCRSAGPGSWASRHRGCHKGHGKPIKNRADGGSRFLRYGRDPCSGLLHFDDLRAANGIAKTDRRWIRGGGMRRRPNHRHGMDKDEATRKATTI